MKGPRRSGPSPTDPVDASRPWRPSPGYLAIALGIALGGLALLTMSSPSLEPVAVHSAAPTTLPIAASAPMRADVAVKEAASAASTPPRAAPPQISRTRDPNGDLTPDLSDYVNIGEKPTMAEVIERLHLAGVQSGLGAFSPPGTRPPLVGLAVPENFPLPEGYVRHYQATDDGQRIEPILMFAPDRPLVDAAGQPIATPKDRVVPPELAPPGLPIRRIVIPAPTEPGK